METIVAKFVEKCKEKKIRLTPQRLEVYRLLVEMHGHPSVDEVYQAIIKRIPYVSKDTVYRTLNFFEKINSISSVKGTNGVTRYEVNTKPHHHFKCTNCGSFYDFEWDSFEHLNYPAGITKIGNISACKIVVEGECNGCLTKIS